MTKQQADKLRQAFERKKMQQAEDLRRMEESDRRADALRIQFKSTRNAARMSHGAVQHFIPSKDQH